MATAKQQAQPRYAVTLLIEGSQVEAVAKRTKQTLGDVTVGKVEKIIVPAPGEWSDWQEHPRYRGKVLVNPDGRVIQSFQHENEDGTAYIDEYTYRVRDDWGTIGESESLEEAKLLVREPVTQDELLEEADELAKLMVEGDGSYNHNALKAAESYLTGRRKELPEVKEHGGEEPGNRRKPEYIVTLRVEAGKYDTVVRKAEQAFGKEKIKSVEKVSRGMSRAAELGEAEEHVNAAKEIVAELKGDAENWRDGMSGTNLESSQKFSEVEECVSQLEDLESELENISFDNVEFPRMF
jgi:hypothetical protein